MPIRNGPCPAGYRTIRMGPTIDPHCWTTASGMPSKLPNGQKEYVTPRTLMAHKSTVNLLASGGMNPVAKLDHFTEHSAEPMRDVGRMGLRNGSLARTPTAGMITSP